MDQPREITQQGYNKVQQRFTAQSMLCSDTQGGSRIVAMRMRIAMEKMSF